MCHRQAHQLANRRGTVAHRHLHPPTTDPEQWAKAFLTHTTKAACSYQTAASPTCPHSKQPSARLNLSNASTSTSNRRGTSLACNSTLMRYGPRTSRRTRTSTCVHVFVHDVCVHRSVRAQRVPYTSHHTR